MFDPTSVQELRSSSGIPIYLKNLPWVSGWVEIRVLVSVGARHDPLGKEGLAHLFEHSLFWGNRKFPETNEIWNFSDTKLLGSLNGNTSFEYTCYEAKAKTSDLSEAIDFLRQLLFFPSLEKSRLEKEKDIITQEIWRKFKVREAIELEQTIRNHACYRHAYARVVTPAGLPETVSLLTLDDLNHFREFYSPQSMKLVFVGDINPLQARMIADKFAQDIPGSEITPSVGEGESWAAPNPNNFTVSHAKWFKTGEQMLKESQIVLVRAFPAPYQTPLLLLTLSVVQELLTRSLRNHLGATYSVGTDAAFYSDLTVCRIRIPVANDKLQLARNFVNQAIYGMESYRAKDDHIGNVFERMKARRLDRLRAEDRTASSIADDFAQLLGTFGCVTTVAERISETEMIQLGDLLNFVKSELTAEKIYQLVILP